MSFHRVRDMVVVLLIVGSRDHLWQMREYKVVSKEVCYKRVWFEGLGDLLNWEVLRTFAPLYIYAATRQSSCSIPALVIGSC